jgi:4-methyl-5(b-hydroxyethyl)-thiazole monophosphate biosynthesis
MKVGIFYYDGFCEFEVVLAAITFASVELITLALENRIYISEEKQKFLPDKTIAEIDPLDIDLFIIPGGRPDYLYENSMLKDFITTINKNGKVIAGICSGTKLMAAYGILDNKKCTGDNVGLKAGTDYIDLFKNSIILEEDVVVDENIITSTGQAFVEFAFKLGKVMNIFENETESEESYKWYKNIKG